MLSVLILVGEMEKARARCL